METEAQTGHSDRQPTSTQKSGTTTDIMKNIYDLEGNYWEWTQETDGTYNRTDRGGNFYNSRGSLWYPASYRVNYHPTGATVGTFSSRATLYIAL